MSKIRLTLPQGTTITNAKQITFRAPCSCGSATHIAIGDDLFELSSSSGKNLAGIASAFVEDTLISIILDTEEKKAYIQSPSNYPQINKNESVCENDTCIVDGNFSHAGGDNARVLSDHSQAFGNNVVAGLKGYHFKAVDTYHKQIFLSKTKVNFEDVVVNNDGFTEEEYMALYDETFETPPYTIGDAGELFYVINSHHYFGTCRMTRVDNNVVTYEGDLGFTEPLDGGRIEDQSFSVPSQPEIGNVVLTVNSTAFGTDSIAAGKNSFAEGYAGIAAGRFAHVEGKECIAGYCSHAEGQRTWAFGLWSHSEGSDTQALGQQSHAEGGGTVAQGIRAHSEGHLTQALAINSHTEGASTIVYASANNSHAEGNGTKAYNKNCHVEGNLCIAYGESSHAEGQETTTGVVSDYTKGKAAHAEGLRTHAVGAQSHAEGYNTKAYGASSHTEGEGTYTDANASNSHAEGLNSKAYGIACHAEGSCCEAKGEASHAEGLEAIAEGKASHAEGMRTKASGTLSHTEGYGTEATGEASHAGGYQTIANAQGQYAIGVRNEADANALLLVGNGNPSGGTRSNAFVVYKNGQASIGKEPTLNQHVANKRYVDVHKIPLNDMTYVQITSGSATMPVNLATNQLYMCILETTISNVQKVSTVMMYIGSVTSKTYSASFAFDGGTGYLKYIPSSRVFQAYYNDGDALNIEGYKLLQSGTITTYSISEKTS